MRTGEHSNLEVTKEVRRVLVMHWIDLGRLSVHTLKDSVHIRGSLAKLPGADSPLTSASVDVIYKKIRTAVKERRLHMEFDNWILNSASGAWEPSHVRDKRSVDAVRDFREKSVETSYRIEE